MKALHTRRGGFTLIELMIVVAIIGILAAIAIPNFIRFQLRAKSSEGKTNLAAIRTAEEGYNAEFGTYVAATVVPTAVPGTSKVTWPGTAGGFDTMGWSPEGDVYFQYQVVVNPTTGASNEFQAAAIADIDGNSTNQLWAYVKPISGATSFSGTVVTGCSANGVYNHVSAAADLLETVGPCDANSGQSEF
jgi:type IV pilus assembly protein PilA